MNSLLKQFILITSCVTLLFLLAGFVSPGWSVFEYHFSYDGRALTNTESLGLWYGIYCNTVEGELVCTTYSHDDYVEHIAERFNDTGLVVIFEKAQDQWTEYGVEASFSLLACILGLVSVLNFRPSQEKHVKQWIILAGISFLLSGILIWVPISALIKIYKAADLLETYIGGYKSQTPYSLILSGSGGVIAFLLDILLLKAFYDHRREQRAHRDMPGLNLQMHTVEADPNYYITPLTHPVPPPSYRSNPPSCRSGTTTRSESPPPYAVISDVCSTVPSRKGEW